MGQNVYPCIIYQRLRPGAPEASRHAQDHVWSLAHELVEREDYTPCGLYGDSEFAPAFCGGSEIRPGFEAALIQARDIASKLGICTLLVGNAAPIGDGDPFLPRYEPPGFDGGVQVRLINFHLRPHAEVTSLRSAWKYFEEQQRTEHLRVAGSSIPIREFEVPGDLSVEIRVDESCLLARVYLINSSEQEQAVQWKQLIRVALATEPRLSSQEWDPLVIPPKRGVYLTTVWQGELPWARQLRVKRELAGIKSVGVIHLTPADIRARQMPLTWERRY